MTGTLLCLSLSVVVACFVVLFFSVVVSAHILCCFRLLLINISSLSLSKKNLVCNMFFSGEVTSVRSCI